MISADRHKRSADRSARLRDASGAEPKFAGRATALWNSKHAHRFEPKAQFLAPVTGADVMATKVTDPFEPVTDRVAVREEPLRGASDITVGLKEGFDRQH